MMRWFGPSDYRSLATTGLERTAQPEGKACAWCDEPIIKDEFGFTIPHISKGADGRYMTEEMPYHYECQTRSLVGSVAHLSKNCSCFVPGSSCTDDPALTRRQAAQAALTYLRHNETLG